MKKIILICSLILGNAVLAADSDYDNPSNSLICTVYTRELGREVRLSVPLTEKGAVLEELLGGRYIFRAVAKAHRCILNIEIRDLVSDRRSGAFGDCSVSGGHVSKDPQDESIYYYYFCKTTM